VHLVEFVDHSQKWLTLLPALLLFFILAIQTQRSVVVVFDGLSAISF